MMTSFDRKTPATKVANMNEKAFKKFNAEVIGPTKELNLKPGLAIKFPFDLRTSLDDKLSCASFRVRWTAYVNNAGTLAHVVCPEADILVRLVFKYPLKHLTERQIEIAVRSRIERWLVI